MDSAHSKLVAREWLYFVGGVVGALFLIPPICGAIWPLWPGLLYGEVYEALAFSLGIDNATKAWALMLGPYGIFQLIRSIRWAIRILQSP